MPTQIAFLDAGDNSKGGGAIPIALNDGAVTETMIASGSNQQSTITAPLFGSKPVCFVVTDVAVYVAIGPSPNAATGTARRWFFPAGGAYAIGCNAGDKAAVVTA